MNVNRECIRLALILLLVVAWLALNVPAATAQGGGSTPRGVLVIPAIRLAAPVHTAPLVDKSYVMPDSGVVWLEGTAWIDMDWARVVLAGHTPGVFARLVELRAGDWIFIYSPQGSAAYQITGLHLTTLDDTTWLMPTDAPTLALITCRKDFRLIVAAERR